MNFEENIHVVGKYFKSVQKLITERPLKNVDHFLNIFLKRPGWCALIRLCADFICN